MSRVYAVIASTAVTLVVFVTMVLAMALCDVFGVLFYRKGSQDDRGKA